MNNKRQELRAHDQPELSSSSCAATLLNDEGALMQFLVRTPAADHAALRCVCKSFQRILDSHEFRRERMLSEWAEVEARLLTRDELIQQNEKTMEDVDYEEFLTLGHMYDGCQGLLENRIQITVDEKTAGSGEITLVDRRDMDFQELCDIRSSDLHSVGCLFFDDRARPKLASVKEAMKQGNDGKKYLVYIDEFELNSEYRQHTWVGARALRQILMEGILRNEWSVAIYIASDSEQLFSHADRSRVESCLGEMTLPELPGGDISEGGRLNEAKAAAKALNQLAIMDLRQFLRAGFQQPKEAVLMSKCYHAFCVPPFLSQEPMISHSETQELPIVQRPPPPSKEPTGENARLYQEVTLACQTHRSVKEKLADPLSMVSSIRKDVMQATSHSLGLPDQMERIEQEKLEELESMLGPHIKNLESRISEINDLEEVESSEELRATKVALLQQLCGLFRQKNSAHVQIQNAVRDAEKDALQSALDTLPELREKIEQMVREGADEQKEKWLKELPHIELELKETLSKCLQDGATMMNSNALHVCAAHLCPELMEIALDFIPPDSLLSAINKRDPSGSTPLMLAAEALGRERWTPMLRLRDSVGVPDIYRAARSRICERLIDLGTDKSITDIQGESALGKYRRYRSFASMAVPLDGAQEVARNREHDHFETMLRPLNGPTVADDAILSDPDEELDEWDYEQDSDAELEEWDYDEEETESNGDMA